MLTRQLCRASASSRFSFTRPSSTKSTMLQRSSPRLAACHHRLQMRSVHANAHEPTSAEDNDVPNAPSSSTEEQPLYNVRPFDPTDMIRIPRGSPALPRQRITSLGVPGDADEVFPYFEACLQVGKMDRAALALKRLNHLSYSVPSELILLHNQYVKRWLGMLEKSPNGNLLDRVHRWYESHIRGENLPQNAETIALMLKASTMCTRKERRDELIERYMSMVPGENAYAVLSRSDILSLDDLTVITTTCPSYIIDDSAALLSQGHENTDDITDANGNSISDALWARKMFGAPNGDGEDPLIRATPQKGLGLSTLKETMCLFDSMPQEFDISTLSHAEQLEVQSRLERDSIEASMARWRHNSESLQKMGISAVQSHPMLKSKLWEWLRLMEAWLQKDLAKLEDSENAKVKTREDLDRCIYGPLLRQTTPERIATVTLLSCFSSSAIAGADRGIALGLIVPGIARAVEEDILAVTRKDSVAVQWHRKSVVQYLHEKEANPVQDIDENAEYQEGGQAVGGGGGAGEVDAEVVDEEARKPFEAPKFPLNRNVVFDHNDQKFLSQGGQEKSQASATTVNDRIPEEVRQRIDLPDKRWPPRIKAKVGAILLSALLETAKIRVDREDPVTGAKISQAQPAFSHTTQLRKGKKVGAILLHKDLIAIIKKEPPVDTMSKHLPMVVEPKPWTKMDEGGFLHSATPMVRFKGNDRDQRIYIDAAVANGDMKQILRGLDVLGKTAWRINRPVYDVFVELWNTGQGVAGIPPLESDLETPPAPESQDPQEKRAWLRTIKLIENEKSALHSQRCFANLQLEIARAFRNQTFYFPHNVDFRGRAYPMPTYLNHMGADHVRGLLRFAKGRPLGDRGLTWLKVHLANVYGYDKASLRGRQDFTEQHMKDIYDSADNPLTGNRWWLNAEDPWQCLAACFELKAALSSPDPTQYVSSLPVHQDGTCNGLQHYAALGGDSWGARQVNLEPSDRPADVYTAVAELVKEEIVNDAEAGHPIATLLIGKVTRKVVKQTVMTNVYGVTFAGARKQVHKQLVALYPELGDRSMACASYIARLIFMALGNMFKGANDIQTWLGMIGGRVCNSVTEDQLASLECEVNRPKPDPAVLDKVRGRVEPRKSSIRTLKEAPEFQNTIVWTTPLRMPVSQPYRRNTIRVISTCLQDIHLKLQSPHDPVNTRKQLQAFPPNFIHSLDASHMMLSALESHERGLEFAAVHDSFWTHAADVDVMNTVLRDAFVRIHSEDVIGRLDAEFRARYAGALHLTRIDAHGRAAALIREWRAKHKLTSRDELLLEYKRQRLLKSEDPEEAMDGMAIETPASIFERIAATDKRVTVVDEDAGLAKLGELTKPKSIKTAKNTVAVAGKAGSAVKPGADDEEELNEEQMEIFDEEEEEEEEDDEELERDEEHGDSDADADAQADVDNFLKGAGSDKMNKRGAKVRQASSTTVIPLWMPLKFPPIPAKGDFDVTRLKDSQYFFS